MDEGLRSNGRKDLSITFDGVRDKNIEQLRVLNNVLFPIQYQAHYHSSAVIPLHFWSRIATTRTA